MFTMFFLDMAENLFLCIIIFIAVHLFEVTMLLVQGNPSSLMTRAIREKKTRQGGWDPNEEGLFFSYCPRRRGLPGVNSARKFAPTKEIL